MASFNQVILMGNLTRDPEVRYTPKGTAVGELGLAVNRRVSDGSGNWTDEVTFVDITVWGTNAENAQKYLTKGRGILVEGRLQVDTWDDKETQKKRSKLKVIAELLQFLPDGKGGDRATSPSPSPSSAPAPSAGSYRPPADQIPDPSEGLGEDTPF
jgi:single-strand DNA-binding protein